MAKLTQTGKTITADFSQIENQYQNNTFDIEVELTDETFSGYVVMLSIRNPQHYIEAYPIPIINGVAKLPYYCTDYIGTTTISLFGYKVDSDDIITTNNVEVEVVASNPTNFSYAPSDDNWANTMKAYVDSMVDQLGADITPSIGEDGYWYIGGVKTDTKADGTSGDYATTDAVNAIGLVYKATVALSTTSDTTAHTITGQNYSGDDYYFILGVPSDSSAGSLEAVGGAMPLITNVVQSASNTVVTITAKNGHPDTAANVEISVFKARAYTAS